MLDRALFRRDLSFQLLVLYLLFVGPVIVAALIFGVLTRARLERDIKATDLALARSIALETNTTFQHALHTVAQIAQAAGAFTRTKVLPTENERAALAPLFASATAARGEIDLIYLLDQQGIVRYHYPEGPVVVTGVDFSFRPYFQEALHASGPIISAGRIALSPATGRPVVTVAAPVAVHTPDASARDLIAADLDLRHLSATLGQIFTDHTSGLRVSTVDRTGQIMADSDSGHLFADARREFPEVMAALPGTTGNQIGRDATGREWLRSYAPIAATGWVVVVQRPTDLAFASSYAFQRGLLIALGVFICGGLFFWLMLSRRVMAPLEQLAAFSTAIAQRTVAPTDHIPLAHLVDRPDQVGRLAGALHQMELAIARRFTELSTLLETSSAVVSTLDLLRVLDAILEQVQRLLAVERCAIVALAEQTNEMRLQAARGLSADHIQRIQTRPLPHEADSASLRAILTRQPVVVADTEADPTFPASLSERARKEGYRALMAVPLVTTHAPLSALVVYWREPHACPPEEINLVAHFANYAAMALENAALFARTDEKLREQTRTLEALVQSLNDGLILESSDGRLLYVNRRLCELAQVTPNEVPQYTPATLRTRLLANAVGKPSRAANEVTLRYQGRPLDLRLQSFDVTGNDGQLIGRGQLWLDVTGDKELDRMKSTLIAVASHELRTPLAIMKGNLSSLLASDVTWDADTQQEFIRNAHAEVDHLSALVTDLLDLSQIEAGTLTLHLEQCALPELVARAAQRARADQRLHVALAHTLPVLLADPRRIEVVLRNLIENAFKYAAPDSPVLVQAEVMQHKAPNGSLCVSVVNTGLPIPPDQREKVFERFHRLDTSLARQTNGAGLGLAICKGFVEAHGGKIWVECEASETIFRFTLPL